MENTGVELLISSTNLDFNDFSWKSTLNFSAIKNEVNNIGGLSAINVGSIQNVGNTAIIQPGSPVSSYFGYDITGIYQTAEEVAQSAQPNSQPGFPVFNDVNGDNQITPDDQIVLGDPFPDFTYGLQNSFKYKNFQLDIFLQGQQGSDLLNINAIESLYPSNSRRNQFAKQGVNRWTPSNTDTKWPSGVNPGAYGPGKISNLVVEDASYLRLRTLQVSYTWPTTKLSFLQSARVYITGQNLFTITGYSGYDPEVNSFGQSNARIDYSSYPLSRIWMLGVNLGF